MEYCILAQELFYNIAYWHRRCFIILHIGTGDVLEYCLLAQELFKNIAYWHRSCFRILHLCSGAVLDECILEQNSFFVDYFILVQELF